MAHDGSEGLSPDGWLPDRISVGVLTRVFTPELVDAVVADAGAREQRRRLLTARLVVYFVLALWLFRGRNCGYGQVMVKLADGLCHQQHAPQRHAQPTRMRRCGVRNWSNSFCPVRLADRKEQRLPSALAQNWKIRV